MAGKKQWPTSIEDEESFDPAVEWFRTRTAMTRGQVDELAVEMRRQVFFITGLSDISAIERVQNSLTKALAEGKTFEEWQASARADLSGPEFTDARLRTIYRTNLQNAFAAGRYAELTSDVAKKRRPYWRFSAVRDSRTTSTCAASHGTVLHMDHPWWKTHVPPLHFNCRSTIVPLTEAEAKKEGITGQPKDFPAARGFGGPPDPVPAEAAKMPTEAEKAAKQRKQEKVRAEEEKADAASSTAAKTRREARRAVKEAEQAKKAAQEAAAKEIAPEKLAEAKKRAEELAQEAKAASREATRATKAAEEADAKARKIGEGVPRNWEPTKESLVRRFGKQLAAPFLAAWEALKGKFGTIPRGAKMRGEDGFFQLPPWQTNKGPKVSVRELAREEMPPLGLESGKLPDLKKEAKRVCSPLGRHSTPLSNTDKAKKLNTVYLASKKKKIEDEINAIKRGKGAIVEITTTTPSGEQSVRFGYKAESGNIYAVKPHQNGRQWRLYPVEGPDFVVLNAKEYQALKEIFTGKKTTEEILKNKEDMVDAEKVLNLFENTREMLK